MDGDTLHEELHHAIRVFLLREPNMSGIFDSFFSEEARAKRSPTREETVYNAQRIREETARNDFSSIWPHVNPEMGGVEGDMPIADWWEKEYTRLMARKEGVTAANCDFAVDENGNITIRQAGNVIQVRASDRLAFSGALFALPTTGGHPGGTPTGAVMNPGQSSSNVMPQVKDDRPAIQANQKRNEERLAYAMRNQAAYQTQLGIDQQRERKRRLREELE